MPIQITITADTLAEALALLKVHTEALAQPERIQAIVSETKAIVKEVEAIVSETKTATEKPAAKEEPKATEPPAAKEGPDLSDVVVFRAAIKAAAIPRMTEEEMNLSPKEGEMALVKRLFAASGVKNSQSVPVESRAAFIAGIPGWLK